MQDSIPFFAVGHSSKSTRQIGYGSICNSKASSDRSRFIGMVSIVPFLGQ